MFNQSLGSKKEIARSELDAFMEKAENELVKCRNEPLERKRTRSMPIGNTKK